MANVPTDQEALEAIREELASIKVPGAESAEADQTWSDLDVDSLDLVEVVKALEDRYDVQIADGRLKSIATVGDAVRSSRSSRARRRARPRDADGRRHRTRRRLVDRRGRRTRSSRPCWRKRSGIADGIGACVDFDPEVAMTPKEARRSDRYTQLAVAAAMQAAEEAGLPDGVDPERLGVLVGTGVGGLAHAAERVPGVARGRRPRRLAALRADDDAQRGRRHDRDAPRRPRPGLQRLERVRHGRPRDRRGRRG